ncbi:DUF4328 domain-containing protein [Phytoactinopolyspora alkaliphila]|uniref:DUF4328 domain-containing protein n=1 Tax=Phytoactinopolyspora alkaliphila TaxID=1783498 RepID=A0A6N9YJR9_9ACTN|nr:DUF4328 domain-containing protein [Phytoactinopolyspora alkaliphila]NED95256.1 DUF4328 domain-containing protein [Phytoactinopolyspora alkaliphila]
MDPFAVPGSGHSDGRDSRDRADRTAAQPPSPGQAYAPRIRPLSGLAAAVTVMLAIAAVVDIAAAGSMFSRASLLDDIRAGGFVDEQRAQRADELVALLSVAQVLVVLATGVVFLVWQFRHAKNAQVLGSDRALGPGWAIGGWFIPIANLLLPAIQIFGASRFSDLNERRHHPAQGGRGAGVVVAWAIMFVAASIVSAARWAPEPAGSIDVWLRQAAAADRVVGFGDAMLAVTAVLALLMVRSLSARQEVALQAFFRAAGSPPGWRAPASWDAPPETSAPPA